MESLFNRTLLKCKQFRNPKKFTSFMSDSCHLDRVSNVEIGVECLILPLLINWEKCFVLFLTEQA